MGKMLLALQANQLFLPMAKVRGFHNWKDLLMPSKLRKLKITRVAVCEQGANPDADILLFKAMAPGQERLPAGAADVPAPGSRVLVVPPTHRGVGKQGMPQAEPDGDEVTPLDYATRGRQRDLWRSLWDKWERFCGTFYDICGDCDADNVPHLPILVDSIGQFQDDVADLLTELGIVEKVAPLFADLSAVSKAGAAMAGHRLRRLKAAIETLQALFHECTPQEIEHDGISAAEAAGIPGAVNGRVPGLTSMPVAMGKGDLPMTVRKHTESDKEHCEHCDDKDCDNPAHDRLKKQEESRMAETLDAVTKRAELAQARVKELEAQLVSVDVELSLLKDEMSVTKMSPEEQRERRLAEMSPIVRKDYLEKEERLAFLEKSNQLLAETNERQSYIAKTADFRQFGMVPEQHWPILKAVDAMPEEPREELLRLLKAATEQLAASPLFQASGLDARPAGGGNGSGNANDQILALAQAYASDKNVPMDKAIEAVAKQHPDLWSRDQREKRFSHLAHPR